MKKKMIIKGEVVEMSFEEVLELFTPAIHREINKQKAIFDRPSEERDDMFQEASIAVWRGFKNHDENSNHHFSTYIMQYIRHGVQEITIKNNAVKRSGLDSNINLSLDDLEEGDSLKNIISENPDLSSPMIAREILSETIKELTDLEAEYLLKMMCGYKAADVANEKGVTRQTAKEKFDKIKKKIEKISIEYGYLN